MLFEFLFFVSLVRYVVGVWLCVVPCMLRMHARDMVVMGEWHVWNCVAPFFDL
jgi:hypothetical protein